jgi:hypothetical protein
MAKPAFVVDWEQTAVRDQELASVRVAQGDGSEPIDALGERTLRLHIQAKDLRPFVLRRWSATAVAGLWSLDDPSFGACFWRATSRERLIVKGTRDLLRKALRLGIENPVIVVEDPQARLSDRREHRFRERDPDLVEETHEVEVIAPGSAPTP